MFRIGEFSRLAQLSIRVLRHYDEIGLLVPANVDPSNGYRYYTVDQLADVNRIIALKDLGLSLELIRRLLHEKVSAEEIIGMLRLEAARAEQARAAAERRIHDLEHRLAELADHSALSDVDIIEKSIPAHPFLGYRTTVPDEATAFALVDEIAAVAARLLPKQPLIAVAHDAFFEIENLDLEIGFPVSQPASLDLGGQRCMTLGELPAVERMLSIVHVGQHEEGHRHCHHALGVWLDRHTCTIAGPGREIIHDYANPHRTSTVEIQYPVATRRNG